LAPSSVSLSVRAQIASHTATDYPGIDVNALPDGPAVCVNARVVMDEAFASLLRRKFRGPRILVHGETIAAVLLDSGTFAENPDLFIGGLLNTSAARRFPAEEVPARVARYPWDLVRMNSEEIANDFARRARRSRKRIAGRIYPGAVLLGRKNILVGSGSVIKPGVVLDAEEGPIMIGKNVTVMPNAVIQGPAFIGDGSTVKIGAKIYHGTSAGESCKLGGEIEASILQSHANKQHDGFLGHSYLGSWVNLGADTNTSDLKNTYGTVRVMVEGSEVDTGELFVGLAMGDHSKTGINVMFDTGTVVGVSCNVYGAGMPPKFLPSFSWGQRGAFVPYEIEKCVETARRVMARRNVVMSRSYEELLRAVHAEAMSQAAPQGAN
jgi:UDP-N-acetylglucosamine diphosphorylase/glucosamine-1-phosphate N-acetyltransferase